MVVAVHVKKQHLGPEVFYINTSRVIYFAHTWDELYQCWWLRIVFDCDRDLFLSMDQVERIEILEDAHIEEAIARVPSPYKKEA